MPKKPSKSEIRKDYLLNKYVLISPGRSLRPRDTKEEVFIKRSFSCPFCPENIIKENICDSINNKKGDWQILSIKNLFSALSLDNKKAYGVQEVIVENRLHEIELADMSQAQIKGVLEMYSKRTAELSKNKKINYILCFKNQGAKAGASIIHAHSQVFASEILPPLLEEEITASLAYQREKSTCAYCDIIKKEMKGPRKIWSDKNVAVFAPYASEYHYEAWIFTKRHIDNITNATGNELASLATALKKILAKLKKLDLAFNLYMHQVVQYSNQHFYIKIQPRDSVWAGVELGSGLIINSVTPEEAALFYKKA